MQLSLSACYRSLHLECCWLLVKPCAKHITCLQTHAQSRCISSVLRYKYVSARLVLVGLGWRGAASLWPSPLIYQRPRLTRRPLPSFLTMGERFLAPSSSEKALFGGSLMLMSRPVLGLRAVNRELTRLVVCLCNVATHLKDGPYPKH